MLLSWVRLPSQENVVQYTEEPEGGREMALAQAINHIALATNNLDATIRFWRDLLGLRLFARLGGPGHRSYGFQLPSGDCVMFFEWPQVEPVPKKKHHEPVKGPFVFDHISFGVEETQDLLDLKDRLRMAGFEVSDLVDNEFFTSIYSFDPNGIPIEFSTSMPKNMKPIFRDAHPSEVALEGPDPIPGRLVQPKTA